VITSYQSDSLRISNLESQKEQERLYRVESSVHKVSHEQIISLGTLTTYLKKLLEIIELAVDISTDRDWARDMLHIALVDQNFFGSVAECLDIRLLDVVALFELLNPLIEVIIGGT
jgi:hypothetical protein